MRKQGQISPTQDGGAPVEEDQFLVTRSGSDYSLTWTELGRASSAIRTEILATGHGFAVGDVIRYSSSVQSTPTFVASAQSAFTGADNGPATIPTGLQAGDLLILVVRYQGLQNFSGAAATGFTYLTCANVDLYGQAILYRVLDGTESYISVGGNVTVTTSHGATASPNIKPFAIGYRGVSGASPIQAVVSNDGSTGAFWTSFSSTYTTDSDDEVILFVMELGTGDAGVSPSSYTPAGGVERKDNVLYETPLQASAGAQTVAATFPSTQGYSVRFFGLRASGANPYVKAKADSASRSEAIGIVVEVLDVNRFVLAMSGLVTGLSGLTPGALYYLDDAVAGLLSATEPTATGHVSKPLLTALTATSGIFLNQRGTLNP